MADFEIAGFSDTMPGEEKDEKPKATRKPRSKVPTRKTLIQMFLVWFTTMNAVAASAWAGANPMRQVWLLQEAELQMEAEAFADVCLEYPIMLEWLAIGQKATPLGKLLMVQYVVFAMRFNVYRQMLSEKRRHDEEEAKTNPPQPGMNGAGPIPDFVPGAWQNAQ